MIPFVGLILYLVWKDTKPKSAKSAGIGAIINVGINIAFFVFVLFIFFIGLGVESSHYY